MPRSEYEPRMFILGGADGHELIPTDDVVVWGRWLQESGLNGTRIVAQTGNGHRNIMVSTVCLGLDHRHFGDGPPLVFETLVFGGPLDGEMDRYGTWAAAEAGHARMVAKVFPALAKEKKACRSKPASSKTEKHGSDGDGKT